LQSHRFSRAAYAYLTWLRRWPGGGSTRAGKSLPTIQKREPSPYDERVQLITWYSPTLGTTKHLHIFLPPSYEHVRRRYPVLYLLRGHEREWLHRDEDGSRAGSNVIDVYLRLYKEGVVGPMILAMPSLTSVDGTVHGLGIDWLQPTPHTPGSGRWEQYLRHDVVRLVDRHWRTRRGARGVDGFSLGGAVAMKMAAKFPGLFRTAGAYDGTFFYATDDGTSVEASDPILSNAIWEPALGQTRDLQHATANSAANLILQARQSDLDRVTWMPHYGPQHIEPWGSNFYRGEHVVAALKRRAITNALPESVMLDGEHTWRTADRHMAMTLPIHWRVLSS